MSRSVVVRDNELLTKLLHLSHLADQPANFLARVPWSLTTMKGPPLV